MPRMRITQIPQGEAPISVRIEWVNLVLDFELDDDVEEGVISHRILAYRPTVAVDKKTALAALA